MTLSTPQILTNRDGDTSFRRFLLIFMLLAVTAAGTALPYNSVPHSLPRRSNPIVAVVSNGTLGKHGGQVLEYQLICATYNSGDFSTANYSIRFYSTRRGHLIQQATVTIGHIQLTKVLVQRCDILRLGYDQLFLSTNSPHAVTYLFNWNGRSCRLAYHSTQLAWARCVRYGRSRWAICECLNASQSYSRIGRGTYYLTPAGELVWRFLIGSHRSLQPYDPCGNRVLCTSLDVSPNGTLFAVGGPRNLIRLYDTSTLRLVRALPIPVSSVDYGITGLAFNDNGTLLAGGGLGLETIVYNTALNTTVAVASYPSIHLWNGNFNSIVFGWHGVDLTCGDGTIYDTLTKKTIATIPATQLLAYSSHREIYACADALLNTLSIYRGFTNGNLEHRLSRTSLPDSVNAYLSLAFSRDGSTLVGSTWRRITIWNTPSLHVRSHIAAHYAALAISPHGRLIACAIANRIDLFSTVNMRLVSSATVGFRVTTGLTFLPTGRKLLSASGDRVYLWRIPKSHLDKRVRKLALTSMLAV